MKSIAPTSVCQQAVVWGVILLTVCLVIDNLATQFSFTTIQSTFSRSLYLVGFKQGWDMFIYDQKEALFLQTKIYHPNAVPEIVGSAYGNAPGWLITPERTIAARLLAQDPTGRYKQAYANYVCRTTEAIMVDLEVAQLALPTHPGNSDPFTQTRHYHPILRQPC
jgi:hypothetical protein